MTQEEKIIGDLKRQWERPNLQGQRKISVSPLQASGNVSLAYYRGRAAEREDIVKLLKRKFPDAANYLTSHP